MIKMKNVLPEKYESILTLNETQKAIKLVKDTFEKELSSALNLVRVSAPLFVDPETGLNDNLNGYEKAVNFICNENNKKLISRHEITASLEDFIRTASFLLKDLGEFYMVHRPDRLVDIFYEMRKNKIEPKKIKFIYPNKNKKTNLVLIKGIKNGKQFLEFENNLYVYNEDGNYTNEILKIYNKIQIN